MIRPARSPSLPSAAPITMEPMVKTTLAAKMTGLRPNRSVYIKHNEEAYYVIKMTIQNIQLTYPRDSHRIERKSKRLLWWQTR